MSKKEVIQKIKTQYLEGSKRIYKNSEAVVFFERLEKEAQGNDLKEYAALFRGGILSRKKDYKADSRGHEEAKKILKKRGLK